MKLHASHFRNWFASGGSVLPGDGLGHWLLMGILAVLAALALAPLLGW